MTQQEQEQLLGLFAENKTLTYRHIKMHFVNPPNRIILHALGYLTNKEPIVGIKVGDFHKPDDTAVPMFYSGETIKARLDHNKNFDDSDTFRLTKHGADLLYVLVKEKRNYKLTKNTFIASVAGVIIGLIGLIIGLLSLHK